MLHSLAALVSLGASLPAAAEAPPVSLVLRPGWQEADRTHQAGLHLSLEPGWHTYWRSPGDSGIAPRFDWSGSENLRRAEILWPVPRLFRQEGSVTIGYDGEVVLPLRLIPIDPAQPVRLRGRVEMGVCRDICIPAELAVSAVVAGSGAPDPAIQAALADRPASAAEAGLRAIRCAVEPIADGLRLTAELVLPPVGGTETVVVEAGQPDVWVAPSSVTRDGARLTAVTEMVAPGGAPFALDRGAVRVTVLGRRGAVEISGCPAP
jgi:DsbC/DsbD-like thiol-disulfide interchange protein